MSLRYRLASFTLIALSLASLQAQTPEPAAVLPAGVQTPTPTDPIVFAYFK